MKSIQNASIVAVNVLYHILIFGGKNTDMKQTENGWQVCDVYNVSLLFVELIKDLEQNQAHNQQQIPYFIDMITSAIKIVV